MIIVSMLALYHILTPLGHKSSIGKKVQNINEHGSALGTNILLLAAF